MMLQTIDGSCLYADVPGYNCQRAITGDTYRPDLLLSTSTGTLYIVELTVGFESILQNKVEREKSKYKELIRKENKHFKTVKFVNLSISSPSNFARECFSFIEMHNALNFQRHHQNYVYCATEFVCCADT